MAPEYPSRIGSCVFFPGKGKKRGPDVLRALRIANHAAEAGLHALRRKPDVPLGTTDGAVAAFACAGDQLACGVVSAAAHGSKPSRLPVFFGVGVDRPECLPLWVGAHSDSVACLGYSCMAEGKKGKPRAEAKGMGQQKDADVRPGSWIRADFAVVDTRGSAVGKGDVGLRKPPGIAGPSFLGSDPSSLRAALREFRDAGHAAWPRESA